MAEGPDRLRLTCPACGVGLHVQADRRGWLTCPSCDVPVWVSSRRSTPCLDRLWGLAANHAVILLLLGLMLAGMAVAWSYERAPDQSPLVWAVFCLAGFTATLAVRRWARGARAVHAELTSRLRLVLGVWSAAAVAFVLSAQTIRLAGIGVDDVAVRFLLVLQPVAIAIAEHLPDTWKVCACAIAFLALVVWVELWERASRGGGAAHLSRRGSDGSPPRSSVAGWRWRLVGVLPSIGKAIGLAKAMSFGVLLFGLSAGAATGAASLFNLHRDVLVALQQALPRAEIKWLAFRANLVLANLPLERPQPPAEGCAPGAPSNGRDCPEPQPAGWEAVVDAVAAGPSPYGSVGATTAPPPPGPGPHPTAPPPPGPGPRPMAPSGGPGKAVSPPLSADAARERLARHLTSTLGAAWDAAAARVTELTRARPPTSSLPRDATISDLQRAQRELSAGQAAHPANPWLTDFTSTTLLAAEAGSAEAVKQAIADALDGASPIGKAVGEFVDLFLTGPAIEAARRRAAALLAGREQVIVEAIAERVRAAPGLALARIAEVARYARGTATPDETAGVHAMLRDEMAALFDRAFDFRVAIAPAAMVQLRTALIASVLPAAGPVNDVRVDEAMTHLADAARRSGSERFELMLALSRFGVDTRGLRELRERQAAIEMAALLRSLSTGGSLALPDLHPRWRELMTPMLTEAWLRGQPPPLLDNASANLLNSVVPPGWRCGCCVRPPTRTCMTEYRCYAPSEAPPCPERGAPVLFPPRH